MTPKKLYRSSTDRVIAGVCGGLAKYFNVDSTLIRVIFVLLLFMGGSSILLYIVLIIVMPIDPGTTKNETLNESKADSEVTKNTTPIVNQHDRRERRRGWSMFFGLILIFIGMISLSHTLFPAYFILPSTRIFWPIVLVLLGLLIVIRRHR